MDKKIGIIGYGSMGKMISSKFIESKIVPESSIFVSNRTYEKIMDLGNTYPQINICKNNIYTAKNVDIIFLCVKPFEMKSVLLDIFETINDNCHIVSLNGSILFKQIEQICVNKKISKIIPSVIAEINQSTTLICHNKYVNNNDKNVLEMLLKCFGSVIELPEMEIGIGSEVTICMPGFIGAILKIITNEAVRHTSIPKENAIKMIIETVYGTGKLLLEKEMKFEQLIGRVATKGGITEEGVKIIENKMPEIINELFERTLEKRKITTENAQRDFNL
jgi:pyrroline-5-carboxylate reductase